jgi:tetratricopeptide (TPR) repeat protein
MEKTEQKDLKGFRRWSAKRRALVFGVALAVLIIAIIVYLLVNKQPSADVEQTRRTAQTASDSGDYDKAFSDLKKIQNQATTKQQKINLYGDLAAAAANAGEVGEALRYYGLKHDLDPGSRGPDAYLMATLYERSGDVPEAIAQYNLALEYLNTQPNTAETTAEIEGIKAILQELEAAQ